MLLYAHPPRGTDHRSAAVWTHSFQETGRRNRQAVVNLAVLTQAKPGLGEDAEPTVLYCVPEQRGLIGVYDGLGGAGARPAGRTGDARVLSNAFVASRLAHLTVQQWFIEQVRGVDGAARDLHSRLTEVLGDARRGRAKLGGTLRRDLPTTIALIEHHRVGKRLRVTARWAGDSRCYVFDRDHGLQQLSLDDSDIDDALQILIADQPMTNVVSASGDFRIHERSIEVDPPCVLVCATDGFFNYVGSPALFEYHLWDCLLPSAGRSDPDGLREWGRLLADRVRSYAADDASLALTALGYKGLNPLRRDIRRRHEQLRSEHYALLEGLDPDRDRERFVQAREESWRRYRPDYTRYLAGCPKAADSHRSATTMESADR